MSSRKRTINIPLFWKFTIMISIVVAIFGFINIYLLWTSVYTSFEQEIDKRCRVLAKIVSEKALTPMVYGDNLNLYKIMDEIKQSDPSVSYIFLVNTKNELIAQTYDSHIPDALLNANSLISGDLNIKVINTSNFIHPVIRDIAYPILNGDIGTVRLGIVEEHIEQQISKATKNLLIMIIVFFVFGLTGAFFFSYIITTPIKKISQKAQIIDLNSMDSEDYNIIRRKRFGQVNLQINDEMDVLVTKFSEMLSRLKNSYIELKETQGSLVQAEKLASLGTLSSGVAHEINNPISGIKNCINRIIKNPENIEQNANYIILIKEAVDKIENVVKHLLNFSRKKDIELVETDLNKVIDNAVILTSYKIQSNKVILKALYSKKYYVDGSSNQLEQVFVNLILNGLDSILDRKKTDPELTGEIEIVINRVIDKVYVHVKDNGAGIPDHIRNNIFDPFFTSKEVGKGTGLGLSVSFNLIKEHEGKIQFSSTLGLGTEFVIELPAHLNK